MGCGLISKSSAGAVKAPASSSGSAAAARRQNRGSQGDNPQQQSLSGRAVVSAGGARAGRSDEEDADANAVHRISSDQSSAGGASGNGASDERASRNNRGEDGPASRGSRASGRRLVAGERVVITSRLPGSVLDHAFCFECGEYFQLGANRRPECSHCGSTFIQYLRTASQENWITADSTNAGDYSFDDQMDNSITASLDETPMKKIPTQASFLRGLPSLCLTEEEVQTRSKLERADPRYACAICRSEFEVEQTLNRLPCSHEFHGDCIVHWLQNNNTCPICRCKMPEATEDEENDEDEVVSRKKRHQQRHSPEGLEDGHAASNQTTADREAESA